MGQTDGEVPARIQDRNVNNERDPTVESITQDFERPYSSVERTNHKYRFKLEVKSLGLVSDSKQPFRCLIRFKKWELNLDKVTPPAVLIQTSRQVGPELKMQELSGILHEVTFSSPPQKLKAVLLKEKIEVELWNGCIGRYITKIGIAQFSLATYQSSNSQLLTEPVWDPSGVQIGVMKVIFTLADLGEGLTQIRSAKHTPAGESDRTAQVVETVIGKKRVEEWRRKQYEAVAVEIEDWKRKEKEKFFLELKEREQTHYKILSDEWEKRVADHKAEHDQKLADLAAAQARAIKELQKLKDLEKCLAHKESQFNAKEAKATQHWASKAQELTRQEFELESRREVVAMREKNISRREVSLAAKVAGEHVDKRVSSRNAQISKPTNNEETENNQRENDQTSFYSKSWSDHPPRAISSTSASSADTTQQPPHKDEMDKREQLQSILKRTNCYNENDAVVKILKDHEKRDK